VGGRTTPAVNYLGAILMPINWRLAAPEVRYILEHSAARALVCDESLAVRGDDAIDGLASPPARICITEEEIAGWTRLVDVRSDSRPPLRARSGGDAVHRLMYTSGTTGRPKGVMITHANLAWKNLAHLVEFGVTARDVGLACGPLYHVGALDLITTTLIAAGASTVIHREFDAAVVGRPDERWGEVPVGHVVLRPGAVVDPEGLIEHCRGQLARFKVPKAIYLLDALPRNPSGKVLKRALRSGN
jgi:fatty-acyl-CoA synthase